MISLPYQPFRTAMVRAALFPTAFHDLTLGDEPEPGLRAALADPVFLEALWLASPSLAADAELLLGKPDELSAKRRRATVTALTKYVLRAGTRATPFGAFAGVAPADWADELDCVLGPSDRHRRIARLDHGAAMRLARAAEHDPSIRDRLRVVANPALHLLAGRLVLPHRLPADGVDELGEQVSMKVTGPLVHTLLATREPIGFAELRADLCAAYPRSTPERITEFLGTLLDQEALISTCRPPLTPDDPIRALAGLPVAGELAEAIDGYRAQPLGSGRNALRAVYALAGRTGRGQSQRDVQVDVALAARPTLPRELVGELDAALSVLARLGVAHPDLGVYVDEFTERYGIERVPLLELLDPFTGLGPPAGYRNPRSTRVPAEPPSPRTDRLDFLAGLIDEALRTGASEVLVDPAAVTDAVAAPPGAPAESLDAFVQLGRNEHGWFAVLGAGLTAASPAGRAFGRFSHVDPRFAEVVADAADADRADHPDQLFAGMAYAHPRGHASNVGIVPPVHEWQIAVGTTPGVPVERQLRLADLEVFRSGDRLALTAPGLDRELVVRAPNLLNPSEAPNAVRFALALGTTRTLPTEWSWSEFERLPFLPRVRAGRIVLTPARWRLPDADRLDEWRARRAVPRFVHAGAFDNRLLLDLDHAAHQSLLRQELNRGVEFVTEALPTLDQAPGRSPAGRHVVEAVVPLRLSEVAPAPARRPPGPRATGVRLVLPGGEWTYAKLYGPVNLRGHALRALRDALAGHDWFFVRYEDPLPHLRVRVRDTVPVSTVLDALGAGATRGVIGRYVLDGYEREIERYGGVAGLGVAERIFCADTRVQLTAPIDPDDVLATATGIELFLTGLGIDTATRRELYALMATGYAREFADDPTVSSARLARIYQQHQPGLRALLTDPPAPPRDELGPPGAALRALGLPDLVDVLGSLTHLHANRRGLTRTGEFRALWLLRRAHQDVEGLAGHVG